MLVNCAAYRNGIKTRDYALDEVISFVEQPEGFIWVALRDPSREELETVRRAFALHPLAIEDARKGHQRPKIEEYEDMLFVVMTLVEKVGNQVTLGEVMVFVGADF